MLLRIDCVAPARARRHEPGWRHRAARGSLRPHSAFLEGEDESQFEPDPEA